jgi:hypothetical protein
VPLAERNDAIETFLFDGLNEALGVGVGIGRLEWRLHDIYPGIFEHPSHVPAPLVVTITNQHAMGAQQAVRRSQRATHLSHEQTAGARGGRDDLDAP